MTVLILDENYIVENDHKIPDLSIFLNNLSSKTEITLILKTHDALYHLCPIRKAVPYLKSAEFSPDYWVGERRLSKGRTLVGGIVPSVFMREMIRLLAERSFAIKGVFLWADLVTQAYGVLPLGWTFIWHDQYLLICHDGILRISRPCYLPLAQELPAILRYLKRFGYQEETPLTLLAASIFTDILLPFVHQEIRIPHDFSVGDFTLQVPELVPFQRLYAWPRKVRKTAYAMAFLNILGISYLSWQIKVMSATEYALKDEMNRVPIADALDETKMEAFAAYRRLSKDRPDPLSLLRQLIPLLKEEAVATYLHWTATPLNLTLHLELKSSTVVEQLLLTLRSQFQKHLLTWQADEEEPLKGTLIIEKQES